MSKEKIKPIAVRAGNVVVKIYRVKTHSCDSFQVADFSSGNRKLLSFADQQQARLKASEIAAKLARGEGEVLALTSKDRASYIRALDLLKPSGTPLEVAALHYAEAVRLLGGDSLIEAATFYSKRRLKNVVPKSVAEVYAELLEDAKARKLSTRYIEDLHYRCGNFSKAFRMAIASICAADIRQYLAELKLSARSHNNFLRAISRLFQFAKERDYLPAQHDELKGIRPIKDIGGEIEIFTPVEMKRLLAVTPVEMLPLFAIGAFAGLRTSEIERLDWDEVNLAQRYIKVVAGKGKTGSRRIVPVSENLAKWLGLGPKQTGKVWPHGHAYLYEVMEKTAAAAATNQDPPFRWKHNGLRHSFISYRVADTQNVNQVALESGNSPKMIFAHYRELVTPTEATAWFSITPAADSNLIQMPRVAEG